MSESEKKIERSGVGNPPIEITKAIGLQIRLGEMTFWARNVIREDGGVTYEKVLVCGIVKSDDGESQADVKVWDLYDKLKIFTIGGHMILEYTPPLALQGFLNIPDSPIVGEKSDK